MAGLEAVAAHRKDLSHKQDCGAAQGLVLAARERLARVLQQVNQRGGVLEEARKCAKQVPGAGEGRGKGCGCGVLGEGEGLVGWGRQATAGGPRG